MDKKTGNHQQVNYSNEADIILSGPAAVQGHVTEAGINPKRTIASVCPVSCVLCPVSKDIISRKQNASI